MKKTLTALSLVLATSLSGCIIIDGDSVGGHYSDWEELEERNRRHLANLVIQTPIKTIQDQMGTPDFNEAMNINGEQVQVLFYRTQRKRGDGATSKDECTPLVFKNGMLTGWGEQAYQAI